MKTLAERISSLSSEQRALLLAKINPAAHAKGRDVDLRSEAELDRSIVPVPNSSASEGTPENMFLTGATGFLGAYLLYELLVQTRAKIYCLVRAATLSEGMTKVRHGLSRYGLETPDVDTRIIPVGGDLSQPLLGMGENRFHELSDVVDLVIHNGARVNFVYPYARLKQANVFGTAEALRLACLERAKPFHYLSTLSVFGNQQPHVPEGFKEEDNVGPDADLDGGYSQSKWVAEQLVRMAGSRGLPVAVYRPSTLAGDSRTGAWNADDFFCRLLKGCIQLGSVPDEDTWFNLIPVDFAGRAVVHLAMQASSLNRTFHLDGAHPVTSRCLVDWITEFGYSLEYVRFEEWINRVRAAVARSADHPLLPLLPSLDVRQNGAEDDRNAPAQSRYDCRGTLALLEREELICPEVDQELMNRYLQCFISNGFLPEPKDEGAKPELADANNPFSNPGSNMPAFNRTLPNEHEKTLFQNDFFDRVFSISVFERLDHFVKQAARIEIARVLKAGGIVSINFEYRSPGPMITGVGPDTIKAYRLATEKDIRRGFLSSGLFDVCGIADFDDEHETYFIHPKVNNRSYFFGAMSVREHR